MILRHELFGVGCVTLGPAELCQAFLRRSKNTQNGWFSVDMNETVFKPVASIHGNVPLRCPAMKNGC